MSIAAKAVRGVAWNMGTGVGSRVVQLVGTAVLTRFVAPGEFGEVMNAAICVATAAQLSSFAFGQYIIARKATPEEVAQATVLHISLGIVAMTAVVLLRAPLGRLVDAPAMGRFVPGLAAATLLDRIRYVPERLLVRDLHFRTTAIVRALGELLYTFVALAVSWKWGGAGVVAGNIARSAFVAVAFVAIVPRSAWILAAGFRLTAARTLIVYGAPITLAGLFDLVSTKWDNMMVSRFHGPEVMGRYNLAYNLADTPVGYVAEHINDVLMPSFSQLEVEARRAALPRAVAIMALVVFPLGVGLGAIAPTLVPTVFDPRWLDMGSMLLMLSVMTIFRPMMWPVGSFLQTQHRTRSLMLLSFLRVVMLLGMLATFGRLGPLWACGAVGGAFAGYFFLALLYSWRVEHVPARRYLMALVPPFLACVPMFAAVTGVRLALAGHLPGVALLAGEILVGAAVYVASAFLLARETTRDCLGLLAKLR